MPSVTHCGGVGLWPCWIRISRRGRGGILFQEMAASLYHEVERPRALCSFIGGLGGQNLSVGAFHAIFEQTAKAGVSGKGIGPVLLYTQAEHREMTQLQMVAAGSVKRET
jgi:pyruvate ferredoxin oxidoreductase alpha subunit